MVKKNIRLKTHVGNGVYNILHPETNSEIVRVGDKNLDETLGELTAQLAQKVGKGNLSVGDINKNLGKLDQTYMSDELLNQITGSTPINATASRRSVTTDKLATKSVTPNETTFIKNSSNLVNKLKITDGINIENNTGNVIEAPLFGVTDYSRIEPNTYYTKKHIAKFSYYDEAKQFIQATSYNDDLPFTTPINASFVRMSIEKTRYNTSQLNLGTILLPYEDFYEVLNNISLGKSMVSLENTDFLTESSNIHDYKNTKVGYRVHETTGNLVASVGHETSGIVKIDSTKNKLTANFILNVSFYDKDNVFLGRESANKYYPNSYVFSIVPKSYYMRYTYNTVLSGVNGVDRQLNYGDVLLPYENYYVNIKGHRIVDVEIPDVPTQDINLKDVENDQMFILDDDLLQTYSPQTQLDMSVSLKTMSYQTLIDSYDVLLNSEPTYITKETYGLDSSGSRTIYGYKFSPQKIEDIKLKEKPIKVLIVAGVHGSEKAGIYTLYNTMKEIVANWNSSPVLEALRWNVEFSIIPCVNPYSFEGGDIRKNANGVDLARNFPTGWSLTDPSLNTYGGVAPLSEPEAQYVDKLISENVDAVYFTSFHNFFTPKENEYFIWNAASTKMQVDLTKKLISKLTRKWKKQFNWLPQDNTTFFGYGDLGAPQGSEGRYAVSKGIQGGTFEIGEKLMLEPSTVVFSSNVMTLGVDAFVNWLALNIYYNTKYYDYK